MFVEGEDGQELGPGIGAERDERLSEHTQAALRARAEAARAAQSEAVAGERWPATDPELAERPLELIERELESLGAQINAAHARWLALLAEFDRRRGWWEWGARSLSEWVSWRCALSPRAAREQVRVARALVSLPLIRGAFSRGELSYSKARALTRVAEPDSEADLLELARHATAAQLERIVRAARRCGVGEAQEQQREAFVRWHWDDDDGSLRFEGKLAPEDGALLLAALEAGRDALFERRAQEAAEQAEGRECDETDTAGGSAEPQAPAPALGSPSNAESLVAVCEQALSRAPGGPNGDGGGLSGASGAERHQVILHVDAETLATDSPGAQAVGPGSCAIADGPGIAPETMRRLGCDAAVVAVVERDGEPLSVGRRTRTVPAAIRRALTARDGRCQFPGCERRRFVDAHHIRHWSAGGKTALSNLVLLCRAHHRLVHEGGYSVAPAADPSPAGARFVFCSPDGEVLSPAPSAPRASPGDVVAANRARGLSIDARTCLTGTGEDMNLGYCVDAVLASGSRSDSAARELGP